MEVENYVKKNLLELNNTLDREGNNLLSFAVQSGYYEICELLIKNGLPINTRNVIQICFNFFRKWETHLFIMPLPIKNRESYNYL